MKKIYAIWSLYAEEMDKLEAKQLEFLEGKKYSDVVKDGKVMSNPWDDDDDEEAPKPYNVVKGIALYDISGKMLPKSSFFTRIFGLTTYEDIANVFSMMAQDDSVENILISMNTPGGAVSGIADVSESWKRLNAMKPITVHTPGMLASAGVWLASNSTKIVASETADVGSIGVIAHHISYQESLEKQGIKVTAIKSAPLKHVGSPYKDLSEEDQKYLQKKVDESDALFKKHMYQTRNSISPEAFDGGTFSAAQSLGLGLIDQVATYTQVFEQLAATADSNNHNYMEVNMKRKVTSAMAQSAIAAGADPNSLEIVSQEIYDALSDKEKGIEAGEVECKGECEEGKCTCGQSAEETNSEENEELNAEAQEQIGTLTAQVETLTEDLNVANTSIENLNTTIKDLEQKLEARNTDPLRHIALAGIERMRIGLGLTTIDMSKFTTESIIAEHESLSEAFGKRYKSGGHVKPKVNEETTTQPKVTSIDKARFRSVGA